MAVALMAHAALCVLEHTMLCLGRKASEACNQYLHQRSTTMCAVLCMLQRAMVRLGREASDQYQHEHSTTMRAVLCCAVCLDGR